MSVELAYPQPFRDYDNATFLDGWHEGKLLLQRSRQGGPFFFYPRPLCPFTGSDDLVWVEVSGRGVIVSFSIIHRPNHPAFNEEVPIILAEVELEEGATLLARIVGCDATVVESGMRIKLLPPEKARRYPLPTFELV
jgi:uncharacterized OB-fold protein